MDNLSSAHVYIRLKKGQTLKDIPPEVLEDCAQLVKQNSIQGMQSLHHLDFNAWVGCKTDNVTVIYTMWNNLKKTQGMDVGQVGFHDENAVSVLIGVVGGLYHFRCSRSKYLKR